MPTQCNTNSKRACNARAVLLMDFLSWPLTKRKAFVQQELGAAPQFVRDSLLKAA